MSTATTRDPSPRHPAEEADALHVDALCKRFGKGKALVQALDGVSFAVRPRQVTGLVGPDGAGKTTLMRIAAGLLVPDSGTVTALGLDSTRDTLQIQGRVSYMPQKFGLYQDLTCQENLDLYADLQGVEPSERPDRYRRLLEMTGLEKFTGRLAGKLSGGMKQKLGLACALVKSPELLLLDEPTVGVDPVSRRELWQIVYEMVEHEGIGVLVATAYLDEAERCHRVVVLYRGRKLDDAEPARYLDQVRGRTFLVTPAEGVRPRTVQGRMLGKDGVIDATIRSGRVRVVIGRPDEGIVRRSVSADVTADIRQVNPTFEDAFMSLLAAAGAEDLERRHAPPADKDGANNATPEGSAPPRPDARVNQSDDNAEGVVHTRNLTKHFGDFTAVADISFDVRRGEIFGLLGPNGAGKSTTFRMLCGLSSVTDGEVMVAGRDLRRSASAARQKLGYMAQQFSLYGQLSVVENLRFYGRAYGLPAAKLRERIDWALEEFELAPRRHEAAAALPGGFKQRLAMAAAMLHEPDILFLDEPTSGVDPIARREFWRRINAFSEGGVTVVVTTHFMEEAEYCDRMLIMSQGRELAFGTPAEIRALAKTEENADPTVEDAFIALAEGTIKPRPHPKSHAMEHVPWIRRADV